MATFTTAPSYDPSCQRRPRVLATKFGDGYEQRGLDGLHPDLQTWRLTFQNRTTAESDATEAFFVTNNTAVTPFDWTPPHSAVASKFLCRAWARTVIAFDTDTITAEFEEVADP